MGELKQWLVTLNADGIDDLIKSLFKTYQEQVELILSKSGDIKQFAEVMFELISLGILTGKIKNHKTETCELIGRDLVQFCHSDPIDAGKEKDFFSQKAHHSLLIKSKSYDEFSALSILRKAGFKYQVAPGSWVYFSSMTESSYTIYGEPTKYGYRELDEAWLRQVKSVPEVLRKNRDILTDAEKFDILQSYGLREPLERAAQKIQNQLILFQSQTPKSPIKVVREFNLFFQHNFNLDDLLDKISDPVLKTCVEFLRRGDSANAIDSWNKMSSGKKYQLLNIESSQGCYLIHLVAANGLTQFIECLIHYDASLISKKDQWQLEPLHHAIIGNSKTVHKMINTLIKKEAPVTNSIGNQAANIMHLAAVSPDQSNIMQVLFNLFENSREILHTLAIQKLSYDLPYDALQCAMHCNRLRNVELLCRYLGINSTYKGLSPLAWSLALNDVECADKIEKIEGYRLDSIENAKKIFRELKEYSKRDLFKLEKFLSCDAEEYLVKKLQSHDRQWSVLFSDSTQYNHFINQIANIHLVKPEELTIDSVTMESLKAYRATNMTFFSELSSLKRLRLVNWSISSRLVWQNMFQNINSSKCRLTSLEIDGFTFTDSADRRLFMTDLIEFMVHHDSSLKVFQIINFPLDSENLEQFECYFANGCRLSELSIDASGFTQEDVDHLRQQIHNMTYLIQADLLNYNNKPVIRIVQNENLLSEKITRSRIGPSLVFKNAHLLNQGLLDRFLNTPLKDIASIDITSHYPKYELLEGVYNKLSTSSDYLERIDTIVINPPVLSPQTDFQQRYLNRYYQLQEVVQLRKEKRARLFDSTSVLNNFLDLFSDVSDETSSNNLFKLFDLLLKSQSSCGSDTSRLPRQPIDEIQSIRFERLKLYKNQLSLIVSTSILLTRVLSQLSFFEHKPGEVKNFNYVENAQMMHALKLFLTCHIKLNAENEREALRLLNHLEQLDDPSLIEGLLGQRSEFGVFTAFSPLTDKLHSKLLAVDNGLSNGSDYTTYVDAILFPIHDKLKRIEELAAPSVEELDKIPELSRLIDILSQLIAKPREQHQQECRSDIYEQKKAKIDSAIAFCIDTERHISQKIKSIKKEISDCVQALNANADKLLSLISSGYPSFMSTSLFTLVRSWIYSASGLQINTSIPDSLDDNLVVLAFRTGNVELCKLFYQHGAELFWRNDDGIEERKYKTPLSVILTEAKAYRNQKTEAELLKWVVEEIQSQLNLPFDQLSHDRYCKNINYMFSQNSSMIIKYMKDRFISHIDPSLISEKKESLLQTFTNFFTRLGALLTDPKNERHKQVVITLYILRALNKSLSIQECVQQLSDFIQSVKEDGTKRFKGRFFNNLEEILKELQKNMTDSSHFANPERAIAHIEKVKSQIKGCDPKLESFIHLRQLSILNKKVDEDYKRFQELKLKLDNSTTESDNLKATIIKQQELLHEQSLANARLHQQVKGFNEFFSSFRVNSLVYNPSFNLEDIDEFDDDTIYIKASESSVEGLSILIAHWAFEGAIYQRVISEDIKMNILTVVENKAGDYMISRKKNIELYKAIHLLINSVEKNDNLGVKYHARF